MKINELVEFVGNSKNKMLKGAQLEELVAKKIEPKKYLSIKEKKALVESIIDECILFYDGVFKFDDIEKYICCTMRVIEAYTNLELSNDIEDDYDLLCQHDLLDVVVDTFKREYDEVNILLQMKCEYYLSNNSIEAQVGKFLTDILDRIDVLTNTISDKVGNFDMSKLPISKDDLNKLLKFLNK